MPHNTDSMDTEIHPETNTISAQSEGLLARFLNRPNDSTPKTLFVAILLCLVCSIVVSTAAVMLKPLQVENKRADIKRNILEVTGKMIEGENIDATFEQFEVKVVDLETGEYTDIDPASFDQRKAVGDPQHSISLTSEQDVAGIGRRARYATVYLLKQYGQSDQTDKIAQIVLPVHGYGLWSTLYGFLSLESDANTIKGLRFYEHAETPGLGGEVDNPAWRAQWPGKKVFDDQGNLQIRVIRGHVTPDLSGSQYKVDGLSGATLTSQGVSNLLKYWLGDHGFGPYLEKLQNKQS